MSDQKDLDSIRKGGRDMRRANLQYADLRNMNLRGINLEEANLFQADLRGADLRGANLIGANLTEANLTGIEADDETVWPPNYPEDAGKWEDDEWGDA